MSDNNWVHISIKSSDGTIFDARAEDGDTLQALVDGATGAGVYAAAVANFDPEAKAVATVNRTFGNTTQVSSGNGGGFGKRSSGFGASNQGKQESVGDKRELGEHEGYTITIQSGKYGWYANAYNRDTKDRLKNQNLPKGADPASFTLEQAIELWAE